VPRLPTTTVAAVADAASSARPGRSLEISVVTGIAGSTRLAASASIFSASA
jgi:hypothetical protein